MVTLNSCEPANPVLPNPGIPHILWSAMPSRSSWRNKSHFLVLWSYSMSRIPSLSFFYSEYKMPLFFWWVSRKVHTYSIPTLKSSPCLFWRKASPDTFSLRFPLTITPSLGTRQLIHDLYFLSFYANHHLGGIFFGVMTLATGTLLYHVFAMHFHECYLVRL